MGSVKRVYVYRGEQFGLDEVYRNENRLKIDAQSVGQYDLVIVSVDISDAGTYTCIENEGLDVDTASETELIILGRNSLIDLCAFTLRNSFNILYFMPMMKFKKNNAM